MESPWEMLDIINNGYNFPTGNSIAWCLTDYFPETKLNHTLLDEHKCFYGQEGAISKELVSCFKMSSLLMLKDSFCILLSLI